MLKLVTLPAQIAAKKALNNVKTTIETKKQAIKDRETKLEAELASLSHQK